MQIDILNIEGKKAGRTIELPDEIFGAEPNQHVIYLAVKQHLAAQRQGTHKARHAEVKEPAENFIVKKVRVEVAREISKPVIQRWRHLYSDLSRTAMTSS